VALLSLLLNTARIKEPRAALVQTRRTGPTSGCPVKIEEPVKAKDEFTGVALLLMAGFLVYVGLYGSPTMQAAFAAGLVLLLLLGGLRSAAYSEIAKGKDSDAEFLARATLIPRVLWKAAYVIVALLRLWKGIIILLR
jgi:hypothetical protein